MRLKTFCTSLAAAALLVGALSLARAADEKAAAEPKPDKDGFYALFDGKSLDGWKIGGPEKSFRIEDGCIVVEGAGPSHLFYAGPVKNHDFKNFHFKAEVQTFPKANSGIYFHTVFQEKGWPEQGFECQVNATHTDWIKTGSLYHVKDIKDPGHKDNEWFTYEILVKGNQVTITINGKVVTEWTQPDGDKGTPNHKGRFLQHGTFAFQAHDPKSKAMYRNVMVKPLDD